MEEEGGGGGRMRVKEEASSISISLCVSPLSQIVQGALFSLLCLECLFWTDV